MKHRVIVNEYWRPTLGPWEVKFRGKRTRNIAKGGFIIAQIIGTSPEARANAHHIIACVNACTGINPEAVPKMLKKLKDIVTSGQYEIDHCGQVCFNLEAAKSLIAEAEVK